jgi:hypothetical protein
LANLVGTAIGVDLGRERGAESLAAAAD